MHQIMQFIVGKQHPLNYNHIYIITVVIIFNATVAVFAATKDLFKFNTLNMSLVTKAQIHKRS